MDKPRHNDHQLAVKKIGKKIKKTPLHPPTLANAHTSKTRFRRSIVPQLTSSPVPPPATMAQPPMMGHAAESPVSVSLQSSSGDSGLNQTQQSHQYQSHSPLIYKYNKSSLPSARFSGGGGILPTPVSVCIPSPQSSFGPDRNQMKPSPDYQQQPPRFNGSAASSLPILPSPRFDGPGILPTPPLKPRSFTSSSMAQGGILGPGKFPRP